MWKAATLVGSLIFLIETKNIPENNTAVLISKYSKVARWGANENDTIQVQEGRSNNEESHWPHRSDVNIIGGQSAIYRYSGKPPSKMDNRKVEKIPAVGEVMQDRFNPRPYFAYKVSDNTLAASATYAPPKTMQVATAAPPPPPAMPPAPPTPSTDFDSFPAVFNVAPSTAKSIDLYTSPYSSYNPPPLKPDDTPPSDSYPPTNQDDYAAPASMGDAYAYQPPSKSPYVSLGPPLAYQPQADDDMSSDHGVDAPPSDHMHGGPPKYPPHSEDDIYYPSDIDSHDYSMDHPPKDYKPDDMDSDMGMGEDMGGGMAPDMGAGMGHDMTMDLAPPPSDEHRGHHFPQYLYDGHHYDDHVYEEIPHTTTEAMEDKRVSTHYSYYYLGRKLWYIPLYFSVYFIIYVTVLILKSIARHKIKYKQKWASSSSSRSSRKIDADRPDIDELHGRVNDGLDKASKMYTAFAM